ncbi:trypsin-like serine protease, partial [Camelimonas sp. ID_303_24]
MVIASGALACAPRPATAIILNDQAAATLPGPHKLIQRIKRWHDAGNAHDNVVAITTYDENNNFIESFCTGTLINHRTILSAAHCAYDSNSNKISKELKYTWIHFNQNAANPSLHDRQASGFIAHPAFDNRSDPAHETKHRDMALFSLDRPVTGIKPVHLLEPGAPLPPRGTVVLIAGYGRAGVASAKRTVNNALRRTALTTIGLVHGAGKAMPGLIEVEFRDPAHPEVHNAFKQTSPVPAWQGQPGAGDSGGPLFMVMADGSLTQIGALHGGGSGYGAIDSYAPVQDNYAWILQNNPLRHVTAKPGAWNWSDPRAWTDRHAAPDAPLEAPDNRHGSMTRKPHGKPGRYYEADLSEPSQIRLDKSASIDRLIISNAEASILIPEGRRLGVELDALLFWGTMIVDGTLETRVSDSPTDDDAGLRLLRGRISGGGAIVVNGSFVQHGGVIAPGKIATPGALVIWGDYVQLRPGTMAVRVNDSGNADRLVVSGKADISGKLAVTVMGKAPATGQAFTVLRASEITGNFSEITSSLPAFTWATHADDNRIILTATGIDYGHVLADETAVVTGKEALRHLSGRIAIAPLNRLAAQLAPEAGALADSIDADDVPFPSTPALAIASLNTMDATTLSRALLALPPSGFHAQTGFGI